MKIEHIAMYVNDLEAAKDFLSLIWTEKQTSCITIKARTFVRTSFPLMTARGWRS